MPYNIRIVSTYPPRRCGLGTFSRDLANALDTAHELGVPVPLSSVVMEAMQALRVDGKEGDDHGGIVQFYEKLAKTEIATA